MSENEHNKKSFLVRCVSICYRDLKACIGVDQEQCLVFKYPEFRLWIILVELPFQIVVYVFVSPFHQKTMPLINTGRS